MGTISSRRRHQSLRLPPSSHSSTDDAQSDESTTSEDTWTQGAGTVVAEQQMGSNILSLGAAKIAKKIVRKVGKAAKKTIKDQGGVRNIVRRHQEQKARERRRKRNNQAARFGPPYGAPGWGPWPMGMPWAPMGMPGPPMGGIGGDMPDLQTEASPMGKSKRETESPPSEKKSPTKPYIFKKPMACPHDVPVLPHMMDNPPGGYPAAHGGRTRCSACPADDDDHSSDCFADQCGGKKCRHPGRCRRHPGNCGDHTRHWSRLPGRCKHFPGQCRKFPHSCRRHLGHCDCHRCHARLDHKLHCVRCGDLTAKGELSSSSSGSSDDSYIADFLHDTERKMVRRGGLDALFRTELERYQAERVAVITGRGAPPILGDQSHRRLREDDPTLFDV